MIQVRSTPIMILGGPDAGKSNYIGALWLRLRRNNGNFRIPVDPDNVAYVERIATHLRQGRYPPRTEPDEGETSFAASISHRDEPETPIATIDVPDMKGEIWKNASRDRQIDNDWVSILRRSEAAMLFVRFGSKENVEALDWITSAELMELEAEQSGGTDEGVASGDNQAAAAPTNDGLKGFAAADMDGGNEEEGDAGNPRDGGDEETSQEEGEGEKNTVPTQLFLCDLLNLLEEHLGTGTTVDAPRVAIMIAAWDSVGAPERQAGPGAFIKGNYPMFHGRLQDTSRLTTRVFGISATGYDLNDDRQRDIYLRVGPDRAGFAETDQPNGVQRADLLMPLAWALGRVDG
jgi:hypothetical protein